MAIDFQDAPDGVRTVSISGRLDIPGTDEIATKFAALTTTAARKVLVDLSQVSFLASIGIRAIITNAKALHGKGGQMVLLVEAGGAIEKTLETTGIDALIAMFADRSAALQALEG